MKFPGYWVSFESGKAVLVRTTFDETDLDPATSWKEAWQNQDKAGPAKGYVELSAALIDAAQMFASNVGKSLSQSEVEQAARYEPDWVVDRCEIQSISELLGANEYMTKSGSNF